MSTADILSLASLISYIAAGVCLLLAVFFWFFFKIPVVYGDLSGRTARKSIEKRCQTNMRTGNKSYRPSPANADRSKLTATMSQANKETVQTEKLAVPQPVTEETTPLAENAPKAPYKNVTTAALDTPETPRVFVEKEDKGTVALKVEAAPAKTAARKQLTMINDVMLIHTNEVIA